ncbi:hypothetical protein DL546_008874 [Coniochaeta pulveracea]|uniref:Uncharacterized protein n=1 Tax=Coniochaeta pulveracea TaxID=177199 RepID=A0A420YJE5_9PEZI|nr:hypothetical protein DL546_008874 [Coniochaeta pulveracea]
MEANWAGEGFLTVAVVMSLKTTTSDELKHQLGSIKRGPDKQYTTQFDETSCHLSRSITVIHSWVMKPATNTMIQGLTDTSGNKVESERVITGLKKHGDTGIRSPRTVSGYGWSRFPKT